MPEQTVLKMDEKEFRDVDPVFQVTFVRDHEDRTLFKVKQTRKPFTLQWNIAFLRAFRMNYFCREELVCKVVPYWQQCTTTPETYELSVKSYLRPLVKNHQKPFDFSLRINRTTGEARFSSDHASAEADMLFSFFLISYAHNPGGIIQESDNVYTLKSTPSVRIIPLE